MVEDTPLTKLKSVGKETAKRLQEAGYQTLYALSIVTPHELAEDARISLELSERIINESRDVLGFLAPKTADELFEDERTIPRITTGSLSLDGLLDGGIWLGEITEFAGSYGTGKTQICFQLCVTTQLPLDRGGAEGRVFYIDSEGTFSPRRITEIALTFDMNYEDVLKNIIVARTLDANQQIQIVKKIANIAKKENIKLVVVDSLASHFRAEYTRKDLLMERQQKIMHHASQLANLAMVHNLAVVVTNQVVANIDDFGGGTTPALGQSWSHRPQQRVFIRKSRGQARIARLFDSPRSPENEVVFYITQAGVSDKPY